MPDTDTSKPYVFPTADDHPATPKEPVVVVNKEHTEDALDSGIEESFPASDPVSVTVTKAVPESGKK